MKEIYDLEQKQKLNSASKNYKWYLVLKDRKESGFQKSLAKRSLINWLQSFSQNGNNYATRVPVWCYLQFSDTSRAEVLQVQLKVNSAGKFGQRCSMFNSSRRKNERKNPSPPRKTLSNLKKSIGSFLCLVAPEKAYGK